MQFLNEPVQKSLDDYRASIDRVLKKVNQCGGIVAVYQIGGLSAPGISDIDLVVIVEDDTTVQQDPLEDISDHDKYFFVHNLFGISRSQFLSMQETSLFHNYEWLSGEKLDWQQGGLDELNRAVLKRQVAMEYLLRMLVNISLDKTYRIFNIRNLLLQTHAIKYDLEFLNVSEGKLFELVQRVISWRANWFDNRPGNHELKKWFVELGENIEAELAKHVESHGFYLQSEGPFRMGRNITIGKAASLKVTHNGFTLPSFFAKLTKKYSRIQNRFNRFSFELPFVFENPPKILSKVFGINAELNSYNKKYLPHFMPLSSSLTLAEIPA